MDKAQEKLGDIFDKHIEFEFDKEDVDATMTTMIEDPYVHHFPTLAAWSLQFLYKSFCRKNAKKLEDY